MTGKGSTGKPRFYSHLFWQLVIAFLLVILLAAGGVGLIARITMSQMESSLRAPAGSFERLWADRLAHYYRQQGDWAGVNAMVAGFPTSAEWGPWNQEWQADYLVATPDGAIVAASNPAWLGRSLDPWERERATPIEEEGRVVGLLLLSPYGRLANIAPEQAAGILLQRFLLGGLLIGGLALVVGFVLSRTLSRPLVRLTSATQAVAAGDLTVRVPARYQGEVGELATAFNTMAEELARADQLRRNLTADVAHELRTPLSVIRGKLEGILDGVYPATAEHIQPALEEMQLLTQLVEDLRLLALAEAGQLTLEKQAVDLGAVLQDVQVNFTPQASDRGIVLALDLPAGLPPVPADRRRIAQVLGNLLTNALNHTPAGGCVTLSAAAVVGMVEVAVTDTGTGIAPEDLPNLFERFWRGEKSRSRASGGTGLGLAIVKQLVELHGGQVRVTSTPGQGACFRFTLPKSDLAPEK